MRGPPHRSQLNLTVKAARIAHNRHRPEAKRDMSADMILRDHDVPMGMYWLVNALGYSW
jgi:hypothetical protein